MSDPSLELQGAIVAALKGAPTSAGDRVYDPTPPDATFPYISMGPCQVLPDKAGCIDGAEVYPQIDVWSRDNGNKEIRTITKEALAALDDQPLVVPGFNLVVFEIQSVQHLTDTDGITRHTALTFHGILTPA